MTAAGVHFPRDVAPEVHHRMASTGSWALSWKDSQTELARLNHTEFGRVRPLPSEAAVREMLDVAYAASQLDEEGRRVRFSLAFIAPEGARALRCDTFLFQTPLSFHPERVAKVALATELSRTAIGVRSTTGDNLEIWGLLHYGQHQTGVDLEHSPTFFTVRALRPGTFTVHFDERLLMLFSRDHWHLFDSKLDLLGTLRDRAGIDAAVARDLCSLGQRMLRHGHGGTILVSEPDATMHGVRLHPSFASKDHAQSMLKNALAEHQRAAMGELRPANVSETQYVRRRLEIEDRHDAALDFIAQLTAIDGAVVLFDDLSLRGFGATIATSEQAMGEKVVVEDPRTPGRETRATVARLGGNRHRSAACFCAQQTGRALAFVASQDGDLSFFMRRTDGLVQCLRPYELGVGL